MSDNVPPEPAARADDGPSDTVQPPHWLVAPLPWERTTTPLDAARPDSPTSVARRRPSRGALAVILLLIGVLGGSLLGVSALGPVPAARSTFDAAARTLPAVPPTPLPLPSPAPPPGGSTTDPSTGAAPTAPAPEVSPPAVPAPSAQAAAVADQVDPGVVNINTVLGFQNGRAAGTGMVVTSSGEVITNNHVIRGATKITATVVGTGRTYTATVVGTAPTEDVAVLRLDGASGLATIPLGDSTKVAVGDDVVAIGNAGGRGGTPAVTTGVVQAIDQTMTASDSGGTEPETLHGLIQVTAPLQPGDSGGPLATTSGAVIGMDTAAATGRRFGSGGRSVSFAIPMAHALDIAALITAGRPSSTIHIGRPAFLGVGIAPSSPGGAVLADAVAGNPAAGAGLMAGDTITGLGTATVDAPKALLDALAGHRPGDTVEIRWRTTAGATRAAMLTLVPGPAD